ncbi:MAG: hypothetical protein NTU61_02325 [Candidatus Altiarchaeota archaeon]|nr:hypothetical protein [Candidatus Altiarchaeota archaeon]
MVSKKKKSAPRKNNLVKDILIESLSEDHVKVIDKLNKPKYDEDIADELDVKATVIRTLLNDLHENGLVEYDRSKNKRTGWYTYLWKRRDDKINDYVKGYLSTKINDLTSKLNDETQNLMFKCACARVPYQLAMDSRFKCSECNNNFVEHNNSEVVDDIVGEITRLNSLLQQAE